MPTPGSLGRVRLTGIIDIRQDGSTVITEQFGRSDERIWWRSNHPKPTEIRTRSAMGFTALEHRQKEAMLACENEVPATGLVFRGACGGNDSTSAPGCAAFMLEIWFRSRAWLDVAERPWASCQFSEARCDGPTRFRAHPYQRAPSLARAAHLVCSCPVSSLIKQSFDSESASRGAVSQTDQQALRVTRQTRPPDAARNRRDICTGGG
ncbi:hypothetical protein CORC01_14188 [Colletotrichum orchidophilum]|uniref:Uncharacterized protein n=1 Tax=Colletotrichum orchidophilum TaxID=1209926 RepID=A0A1G4AMW5_9PEZI|nr:uncharacterized protein CORC01_14188 [Colletotrichum orchidophilum]OHE90519.1 hypothetical protein CORC01_14188 [Colletotrichum orchidophilum]